MSIRVLKIDKANSSCEYYIRLFDKLNDLANYIRGQVRGYHLGQEIKAGEENQQAETLAGVPEHARWKPHFQKEKWHYSRAASYLYSKRRFLA